jgi:hypothetical protein
MHLAAAWGNPEVMRRLIDNGGDLASQQLVARGPHPKGQWPDGCATDTLYPFDTAVRFQNEECAMVIFRNGAEINPARLAAVTQAGMVKLLHKMLYSHRHDASRVAMETDPSGKALIHYAALSQNPDMVSYLVKTVGVDVSQLDGRGRPASSIAHRFEVYRRLLELGAPAVRWRYAVIVGGT